MSENSKIEWTDTTWNPVRGCTKVSPGCANCYADVFAERFRGVPGHPYEQGFDLRLVPDKLTEPLRWKKPRRVFVNSMSDLFQDGVPDSYIDQVFQVMPQAEAHTFQILTKRAERMRDYAAGMAGLTGQERSARVLNSAGWATRACEVGGDGFPWPLPNVWLGVSVENQHFAEERIPLLLQTPAAVRFISAEPLLGPIDFNRVTRPDAYLTMNGYAGVLPPKADVDAEWDDFKHWQRKAMTLNWVIVGGESGHGARPFEVAWARSIVQQCKAAGVPVFVKQLGADVRDAAAARDDMGARDVWPAGWMPTINRARVWRPDLADRKGGDPSEWPADLRVREFPEAPTDGARR